MAGALGGFGHARRGDDLSGELIDGANVNELAGFAAIKNGEDLFLVSAQGFVIARDAIGGRRDLCRFGRKLAVFFEPLFAASVDEANILVAVVFQLPEGVSGEPVVVVAIEKDGGAVGNAGGAEKFFERGLVDQIAADVVLELGLPVPSDGTGMWPWS